MSILEVFLLIYSVCTTLIILYLTVKYRKRELEYLNESIEREKRYGKYLDTIKHFIDIQQN